jgi:hypothetical protein
MAKFCTSHRDANSKTRRNVNVSIAPRGHLAASVRSHNSCRNAPSLFLVVDRRVSTGNQVAKESTSDSRTSICQRFSAKTFSNLFGYGYARHDRKKKGGHKVAFLADAGASTSGAPRFFFCTARTHTPVHIGRTMMATSLGLPASSSSPA